MNGIYSEEAMDVPVGEKHQWKPGVGYQSAGPEHYEQIAANAEQRTTLDSLAKLADMANRIEAIVTAYEDYADAIEIAHNKLYNVADENDLLVDGVPEWWREEVLNQRAWRNALVDSVRTTANQVAETYGVR